MQEVLLVAYLLIVLAMIGVILLQRSEGGGLGMGGGGNNGLISVRGSANLLTRTTAILATLFFVTAIGLAVLAKLDTGSSAIADGAAVTTDASSEPTNLGTELLDALQPPTATLPDTTSSAAPVPDATLAPPAASAPADTASSAPAQ